MLHSEKSSFFHSYGYVQRQLGDALTRFQCFHLDDSYNIGYIMFEFSWS